MPRLYLILLSSLLPLALPGGVEASPKKAAAKQTRPLNLSLPRDVQAVTSGSGQPNETVMRNLQAPDQTGKGTDFPSRPVNLPYGAGYEHRHQEMGGMGSGGGAMGSGGGAGSRGR